MLRAVAFQLRGRVLRKPTLATLGDRSLIWARVHHSGTSKVVYANPPDHPEMLVWSRYLQPQDIFIDVGANAGSYTIWAAERGAHVLALEPAADTFAFLMENIALNGYRVESIQAAAGATCGTARFTSGLDCVNRLDPRASVQTAPVTVDMVTVDSIVGNRTAAGMKVDVEGFEIDVLRGSERALSERRIGLIQLEWNTASQAAVGTDRRPVADFLARHGYGLFRPDRDGTLVPLDDLAFGPDVFAHPVK